MTNYTENNIMDHVPVIGVSGSKEVDERIKSMCVNYLQLQLDCAKDEKFRLSHINIIRQLAR